MSKGIQSAEAIQVRAAGDSVGHVVAFLCTFPWNSRPKLRVGTVWSSSCIAHTMT